MPRIAVLLATACLSSLALASPASADWYGKAVVKWKAAACVGINVGDSSDFRYRRPFIANKANITGLAFYTQWGAQAYQITGHLGYAWTPAKATGVGWDGFVWTGARAKLVSQSPATLLNDTRYVNLTVDIEKWWGQPGCTVSINASVIRTNL